MIRRMPISTRWFSTAVLGLSAVSFAGEPGPSPGAKSSEMGLPVLPPLPDTGTYEETVLPQSGVYRLDDLTSLAEQNNPKLRAAAANISIRQGATIQAGLKPNPWLEVGSQQWGGNQSQIQTFVSQEFVTRGKLQLSAAAENRTISQAQQMHLQVRFELLTTVRREFFSTLVAQRRTQIQQELVSVARRSKDAADALRRGGESSVIDTLFLEVELERAEVALQNSRVQLDAKRRQLAASIGLPEFPIEKLQGTLTQALPNYHDETLRKAELSHNSQLMQALNEIEKNQFLVQRAEVEPFPNITGSAGYLHQGGSLNNYAILSVGVPLPVWNKNQGNRIAAQAAVSKANEDYQAIQLDLCKSLAGNIGQFVTAEQLVDRYENQILPRAQRSLELTQEAYRQGQFDVLRLLQAQRAFVEARLAYLDAQELRWVSAANIAGLTQQEVFP